MSSSTLDRLRELVRNTRRPASAPVPEPVSAPECVSAPEIGSSSEALVRELVYEAVDESGLPMPERRGAPELPGASRFDTPLGECVVVDRVFERESLHGRIRVEDGSVSASDVVRFCDEQSGRLADPRMQATQADLDELRDSGNGPVMFLDLETTGLSGGAGTVAFLVGCGYFEDGAFRTRQFLLPGFAAERALLHAVATCLESAGCLVTYNGKTFDLPVMETRWLFHRQPIVWTELTHLDMLHVSRRLWRARGDVPEASSCRLVFLERDLFGVIRMGDVPGFEIPGRYFEYVRYGDASLLEPVLHHNRLDLLSLALLTARAIHLLRETADGSGHEFTDEQERLAVGRELLRMNRTDRAEACFRAVADSRFATDAVRAEALYVWARSLRRARRYREAAEVWRRLVACRSGRSVLRAEAQEALAVHYEHRDRDLDVAHQWAEEALTNGASARQREAVTHRLARLQRKIAVQTKGGPETAFYLPWNACD